MATDSVSLRRCLCDDITTLSQLRAVMCGCRMRSMWSGTLCVRDDTTTLSPSRAAWELSRTRVAVWTVPCP
jgi:hypothetical protein